MGIEVRTLRNGERRYDVRLRNPSDRAKEDSKTFRTRKDAEAYQAQQRADRSRGLGLDPRRAQITVSQWADHWLASNPAKRPSTRARDESVLERYVKPTLGARRIGGVTPADIAGLVAEWAERLAPRTVATNYGVVRAVLRSAVEADLIGRSPCRGIKLPATEPVERYIVSAEDLDRLVDAMPWQYAAMPLLGAVLGLRWGEVAGLKVGRLDFLNRTLAVAETVTRGKVRPGADEKVRIALGPPKSRAGRRRQAVPAALMDMLAETLRRQGFTGADPDALVFPASHGGLLHPSNWRQRVWLPACKTARLKGLRFHDLRSACATGMVAEGVDPKTTQARMGHADVRTTLAIYAQATTEADRIAADKMGNRLMKNDQGRLDAIDAG